VRIANNSWRIINTTASIRLRQIIDLLATDKSQYFAQPRPTIDNYVVTETNENLSGVTEYDNEEFHSAKHYQLSHVALFVLKARFFSLCQRSYKQNKSVLESVIENGCI